MEIRNILAEMVEQASLEVGFPFDEGCTEYVEMIIYANHKIRLDDEEVVTWQLMKMITEEVKSWQKNVKLYLV